MTMITIMMMISIIMVIMIMIMNMMIMMTICSGASPILPPLINVELKFDDDDYGQYVIWCFNIQMQNHSICRNLRLF